MHEQRSNGDLILVLTVSPLVAANGETSLAQYAECVTNWNWTDNLVGLEERGERGIIQHQTNPKEIPLVTRSASVAAEGITFCRSRKRNLNDPIYYTIRRFPFHHQLARVHSILCDNVKQLF